MHDENEARWRLRHDPEIQVRMSWPTLIPTALAYVATELEMQIGEVAYVYLIESKHFGGREEIKRHFAPIVDSHATPDWEHVYYVPNFSGVLGPFWDAAVPHLSAALRDARAVGATKVGLKLRAELAKVSGGSARNRIIVDAVEGVIETLTRQALADLKKTDRPADAAGFAAN